MPNMHTFGIYPYLTHEDRIHFFGMQRTGNHAITYWLFGHHKGKNFWHSNENYIPPKKIHEPAIYKTDKKAKTYSMGLVSYEDTPTCKLDVSQMPSLMTPDLDKIMGKCTRVHFLIVLRDPYNFWASRTKYYADKKKLGEDIQKKLFSYVLSEERRNLWKTLARIFLGEIKFEGLPLICVNYNQWFADEAYRRHLSGQLGWEFTDELKQMVPKEGGGSSFDGRLHDGRAESMKVLDRWQVYHDNPEYQALIDDEMKDMSRRIFNFNPF